MPRPLARRTLALLASLVPLALATAPVGCGARSSLHVDERGPRLIDDLPDAGPDPVPDCLVDADCAPDPPDLCQPLACQEGKCVVRLTVTCDDGDPCTADACQPATGTCLFTPLSFDLDNDGFKGPRAGTKAGDPGSCGDDCDDTSPLAHPGAKELCDGVDNDCNGVIDDSAKYLPVDAAPVQISDPAIEDAYASGMAYADIPKSYLATYTGEVGDDSSIFARTVGPTGQPGPVGPKLNGSTGDASGGPIVWTGDRYGMVWSDRRTGDYEVFANTFGPDGKKLGPDRQLSNADGFSVSPSLAWNGTRFLSVWQDDRSGVFVVFARAFGLDGQPVGDEEIALAAGDDSGFASEAPAVAATSLGFGVVYRYGTTSQSQIRFVPVDAQLQPKQEVVLIDGANYIEPSIVANGASQFVITWGQKLPFKVFAAVVDFNGQIIVKPTELDASSTDPVRGAIPVALGDRLLVAYSRQFDDGYDLFTRTFDLSMAPLSPPQRLTQRPGDDFAQSLVFGPSGDVGVLFNGKRAIGGTSLHNAAYFTRLQCDASAATP